MIKSFIYKIIKNILNIILKFNFIKIRKKKITFISYPDLSDNSWHLFNYIHQNRNNLRLIWLLNENISKRKKNSIIEINKTNKLLFIKKKSLMCVYHFLSSRIVFFTHNTYFFSQKNIGPILVNLWHGMPIKNIENYDKNNKSDPDSSNIYIVTSKFYKEYFYKIFNVEQSSVLVTGLPRNDFLINGAADIVKALKIKLKVTKVIMWMPTFRESNNKLNPIFSIENISLLNLFLEKSNSFCTIKLHPQDNTDLTFIDTFDRIKVIDDKIFKKNYLYEFFNSVDILLTDFSSIYIDFLLLNKPIGFFTPDIKSYSDERGFLFKNIEDIIPGEILKDMNEVVHFLENIIVKNKDVNIVKREKVKDLFHDIENNFSKKLESKIL